jgi:hypothetical protein
MRRSRRTTEAILEQIFRPCRHVIRLALSGSEPRRGPWPVLDRPKVTADVIEYRRHLLLGKLLD